MHIKLKVNRTPDSSRLFALSTHHILPFEHYNVANGIELRTMKHLSPKRNSKQRQRKMKIKTDERVNEYIKNVGEMFVCIFTMKLNG